MVTFRATGKHTVCDLDKPCTDTVRIDDVAHRLACTFRCNCAFSSKYNFPYSVANHCTLFASIIEEETGDIALAYEALMHELDEYFIGDVVTLIKDQVDLPKNAKLKKLTKQLHEAYDVPYPTSKIIKLYDKVLAHFEIGLLFPENTVTLLTTPEEFELAERIINKYSESFKKTFDYRSSLGITEYIDDCTYVFKCMYNRYRSELDG